MLLADLSQLNWEVHAVWSYVSHCILVGVLFPVSPTLLVFSRWEGAVGCVCVVAGPLKQILPFQNFGYHFIFFMAYLLLKFVLVCIS